MSAMTTFWSAITGYPVAYTMANTNEAGRGILMFFVMVPFWTSVLARTFGWIVILQKHGLINNLLLSFGLVDEPVALLYNRLGVLVGMVQISLPFMIVPLYSVMVKIDKNYTYAASTLGAGPVHNFWRIYLPLSLPGASRRRHSDLHKRARVLRNAGLVGGTVGRYARADDCTANRQLRKLGCC
jgi:putative spermidine/putrescine transport system permease protein